MKTLKRWVVGVGVVGAASAVVLALAIHGAFAAPEASSAGETGKPVVTGQNVTYYSALVAAAALAAGFGFLGGGYAVAKVGAAALGAASERPELLVRSLVFVALGEGIAIFGLVVAILLVLKLP